MTIGVVVRTGSAVVFAADSRTTATDDQAPEPKPKCGPGCEPKPPRSIVYDHATKLLCADDQRAVATWAGLAAVGKVEVEDIVRQAFSQRWTRGETVAQRIATRLTRETRAGAPSQEGTAIVVATAAKSGAAPLVWGIVRDGDEYVTVEPSRQRIVLLGTSDHVDRLLSGMDASARTNLREKLRADYVKAFRDEVAEEEVRKRSVAILDRAIASIQRQPGPNLDELAESMPLQDAVDLAVFLANVQVQTERFLPGVPKSGGAIDVMVLQSRPTPSVISLPGKTLRHPNERP